MEKPLRRPLGQDFPQKDEAYLGWWKISSAGPLRELEARMQDEAGLMLKWVEAEDAVFIPQNVFLQITTCPNDLFKQAIAVIKISSYLL